MKKRAAILSIFYILGQISQGLVFHPYQTMQSLVRDRIFIWMSFLPLLTMIFGGWVGIILVGQFLPIFVVDWLMFYCFYWQCLLIYLLVRFSIGFHS